MARYFFADKIFLVAADFMPVVVLRGVVICLGVKYELKRAPKS
ncbi:hypothetical protein [Candidatus Kuenenia sp.]